MSQVSTEKGNALQRMEELMYEGVSDFPKIVKILLEEGVSRDLMGWLHKRFLNIHGSIA